MGNSDKDFEKSNQCAFDAYCKVILRNEARDVYDQRKRKLKREQLFGEMSPEELNKLITTDRWKTVCISLCAIRAYTMRS